MIDSRELGSLIQEVLSHPMPHRPFSVIHLWSPIFHKLFWAGNKKSHILLKPEKNIYLYIYLFSKQVCIHAVFSAFSSYSSWNCVCYGTRKSNGSFEGFSTIINSPSDVMILCAITGGCCGNNDGVGKNSVRDVASGAQEFCRVWDLVFSHLYLIKIEERD